MGLSKVGSREFQAEQKTMRRMAEALLQAGLSQRRAIATAGVEVYFQYLRPIAETDPSRLYVKGPSLAACRRFAEHTGMTLKGPDRSWKMQRVTRADDFPERETIVIGPRGLPLGPCVTVSGGIAEVFTGSVDIIDFDNLKL